MLHGIREAAKARGKQGTAAVDRCIQREATFSSKSRCIYIHAYNFYITVSHTAGRVEILCKRSGS